MSTPLPVIRYLAELDAALKAAGATDRDQIVQQIAEHIDEALAELDDPSDDEVAEVLANLGDPLVIAHESTGRGAPPPAAPPRPSLLSGAMRAPIMTRPWIPLIAVIPFLIAEIQCLAPLMVGGRAMAGLPTFVLLAVLLNVWWWASLAIVIISPLFRTRAAMYFGVALPVMALVVPPIAEDLLGSPNTVHAVVAAATVFGLPIAVAAGAVLIAVRATTRARATAAEAPATNPGR